MSTIQDASDQNNSSKTKVYSSLVYVGIVSSIMLFAGLSSAVLVRKMDKFWVNIHLPSYFLISTIVILLSSLTLVLALKAAKSAQPKKLKGYLFVSVFLGVLFCCFQYFGWKAYYNSGNAVKSFITYVYGQYGQSYYISKGENKIDYNGERYEIGGTALTNKEVDQIKQFTYQFCGDDYGFRSKKINITNLDSDYNIHATLDNSLIKVIDGYPYKNGIKLSESESDELFKFAFGVYQNKPFFMLEGEYGKDFSVSLNGEDLDYSQKQLFFPSRALLEAEIQAIDELVFQGGEEYHIKNGAVFLDETTLDLQEFETYLMLSNGIEVEIKNGKWTQLRQELNSTQYGEFFQTTNVSSSFVWVLTGMHFLHICLGILMLIVVLFRSLKDKYNAKNQAGLKSVSIFWHFIGLLWVYLYVFLEYIN